MVKMTIPDSDNKFQGWSIATSTIINATVNIVIAAYSALEIYNNDSSFGAVLLVERGNVSAI